MTEAQILALINVYIVANGNNEITADVLAPILRELLAQPNDKIGELVDLDTTDKTSIVNAINELVNNSNSGFNIHTGTADPNVTQPATFGVGDWYIRNGLSIYQYNGDVWVLLSSENSIQTLQQVTDQGNQTDDVIEVEGVKFNNLRNDADPEKDEVLGLDVDGNIVLKEVDDVNDATPTEKGIIKLAGDLGGTADSPTTPTALHKTGDETFTGFKRLINNNSQVGSLLITNTNTATTNALITTTESTEYPAVRFKAARVGTIAQQIDIEQASAAVPVIGLNIIEITPNDIGRGGSKMIVLENKKTSGGIDRKGTPITIIKNSLEVGKWDDDGNIIAESVSYDNTASGLSATTLNEAVDELNDKKQDKKEIKIITGQSYIIVDSDENNILIFQSDLPVTVTIPTTLPSGFRFEGKQWGDGQVSIVGASGVTVNTPPSSTAKTAGKFSVFAVDLVTPTDANLYGTLELE